MMKSAVGTLVALVGVLAEDLRETCGAPAEGLPKHLPKHLTEVL